MRSNPAPMLLPCLAGAVLLWLAAVPARAQSGGAATPAAPPAATEPQQESARQQDLAQVEGQRVVTIRVVDESGHRVLESNPMGLPLQPGQPFTLDAERESLRQLFRTGRYADLQAETTPVEGGLQLDFVVRRNFFVNAVHVLGVSEPPSEDAAASSMRLNLGEAFRESEMPAALERLQRALEEEGLYQAKLTYHLDPHEETRQMDIDVSVQAGPRARVGAITVVNQTPFPEVGLRGQLKLKPKKGVEAQALRDGRERARKWLVKRGYLGARVDIVRGAYDPKTNEVPLEVRVAAGLNMHVVVEGAKISQRPLRPLLPLYAEGAVDEDLLEEGRRNLRDYFERQGYFDAEVKYTTSQTVAPPAGGAAPSEGASAEAVQTQGLQQGAETITYQVMRGPQRRLVGTTFTGNHYFDNDLLRTRVRIQSSAFGSPGRFSAAQLQEDVTSITQLYQANGFRQVQVKSEVDQNYHGRARDFFVRFEVTEGPQTRIAELKIEGNRALNDTELLRVIGSTSGQPFSDFNVAGDRDNVLALYYNQGFSEARFQAEVEDTPGSTAAGPRVNVIYEVEEGPQVRVAQVLFGGQEHVLAHVIRREIKIEAGQPLSQSAVAETQRRLYGLRIFNRVSIAPQNPTGSDPEKTVDVLVEEAKRYTIAYGLGLEVQRLGNATTGPVAEPLFFSPRVTFDASKLDLTGRADSLSFEARASLLQGRGLLSYTVPYYFGKPNWTLQIAGLYDKSRDVLTFTSTRGQGSVQLTDQVSAITSFVFRYSYRHVVASDLQIQPEEIPLFSQPTDVSFFTVSWLRDHRDSPVDPTQGVFNSATLDYAARSFGSSSSFLRGTLQDSTYTRIGRRLVFARSTRLGIQQPLGQTTADNIPLPERFFAGGGTSLRGFGLNQAGPRDPLTGFPIGGTAVLIFNQQLQFPMRLPRLGNRVSGAVFYDAGNVFSSFGQITLRTHPIAPVFSTTEPNVCVTNCNNALNYFSHTVGLELRYHTPAVPISIDLAYQLNPAQFLIPTGSTTGVCATTTCLELARLPAFQFFVNLGASF